VARYKWLKYEPLSVDYKTLSKVLQSKLYSDEALCGFVVDEVRQDYLKARFIVKVYVEDEIISPIGEVVRQVYTTFDVVRFELGVNISGILVVDPPRSLVRFINEFGLLTGFKAPVTPVDVNLMSWIEAVQDNFDDTILISLVECDGVVFDDGASASIKLTGHAGLDLSLKSYLGDRGFKLKKVKLRIGDSVYLFTSKGSVTTNADFEGMVSKLSLSLPSA